MKRWLKRADAEDREATAQSERKPDPANPKVHFYTPHVEWTSPGGRGYAEKLWQGIRGGYVISLDTGMTKVGRANSVANRLCTHFKNCENYGVGVVHVAVLAYAGDLPLMEQSLKRFIKDHPESRSYASLMESAYDVPFADVVAFLLREQLGDLWLPITALESTPHPVKP